MGTSDGRVVGCASVATACRDPRVARARRACLTRQGESGIAVVVEAKERDGSCLLIDMLGKHQKFMLMITVS